MHMESLVKSDIFFFISTICLLVITALIIMILSHVLHIVRKVRKAIDIFHCETDGIVEDFDDFRAMLRKNQFGLKPIFDGIKKKADQFSGTKKKPRTRTAKIMDDLMNV